MLYIYIYILYYILLHISFHEFCVLDQKSLFFIPGYHFVQIERLQRPNGEIWNIRPTIIKIIDISHDRFLSGKHGGKGHASSVKKEALFRKVIQKEVSSSSSQVKINQ